MIWILIIATLLLLAYGFDPLVPPHGRHAIVWRVLDRVLIRIGAQYVLMDEGIAFAYIGDGDDDDETYVPAVRLDNRRVYRVLNHRYLLEWMREPPRLIPIPAGDGLVEVLNSLRVALRP